MGPAQPLAQTQLNPLTSSVHVPPLAQGDERHSSISERGEELSEDSESRSQTTLEEVRLLCWSLVLSQRCVISHCTPSTQTLCAQKSVDMNESENLVLPALQQQRGEGAFLLAILMCTKQSSFHTHVVY